MLRTGLRYSAEQLLFFLVYFPGHRKNRKSNGSKNYFFFFRLPLFISRAAEKKSKTILLIFHFSWKKVKNYTILVDFWSFSTFFSIAIIYFRRPRKNRKSKAFFGISFFFDCHYLFPAGSAKSKKKSNCSALYRHLHFSLSGHPGFFDLFRHLDIRGDRG